jgi:hypothetical protein
MIRLKDLLSEQTEPKKLRVLFVGDSQTGVAQSYARELLKQKNIQGKIVSKANATSTDVLKMLEDNMSKRYDVVSIFAGDADAAQKSAMKTLANYKRMISIVKEFNAKSVIITPPTKQYIQPGDSTFRKTGYPSNEEIASWLERRSGADVIINTQDLDFDVVDFAKDHMHLDKDAQQRIAKIWNTEIRSITATSPEDAEDVEDAETEKDDNLTTTDKSKQSKINKSKTNNLVPATIVSTAVVMDPDTSDVDFYSEILQNIGAPVSDENLKFFYAWRQAEGATAAFNPFNTTQPMPGATKYNSVGVRNYKSAEDGIAATVKTLTNGRYPEILSKLKSDAGAVEIANSISDLKTWGTGAGVLRVLSGSTINPPAINGLMSAPKDLSVKDMNKDKTSPADDEESGIVQKGWDKLKDLVGNVTK